MKGYKLLAISLPSLAVGVALALAYHSVTASGIVTLTAAMLIATGVLDIALLARTSATGTSSKTMRIISRITGGAAAVLGIVMLIRSDTFVALVPWGLGLLLAIAAIAELFVVIESQRGSRRLDWWWTVSALAIAIAAGYVLTRTTDGLQDASMMLVTGIALGVFGLVTTTEALLTHEKSVAAPSDTMHRPDDATPEKTASATPRPLDEDDNHPTRQQAETELKSLDSDPK